jgi:hypothetical protein
MQRIRVIKSPFALVVLLLILGPVAELWPYWVSFLYSGPAYHSSCGGSQKSKPFLKPIGQVPAPLPHVAALTHSWLVPQQMVKRPSVPDCPVRS